MHRKAVKEIMRRDVITIHPEELVVDAAQIMEEFDTRSLPVVDDNDCIVGIVTDTDILEAETAGSVLSTYDPDAAKEEWLTVADIMTPAPITIAPTATVGQLVGLFMEHKIGGVPVVQPHPERPKCDQVVGIATQLHVFEMIAQAWAEEELAANALAKP